MSMGNRTNRGDALILAICIIAILARVRRTFYRSAAGAPYCPWRSFVRNAGIRRSCSGIQVLSGKDGSVFATGLASDHVFMHRARPQVPPPPLPPNRNSRKNRYGAIRDIYWVDPPYVYVKITRKSNIGYVYTVVEPVITTREKIDPSGDL